MARTGLVLLCIAALAASTLAVPKRVGGAKKSELSSVGIMTIINNILNIVECTAEESDLIGNSLQNIVDNSRSLISAGSEVVSSWKECGSLEITCYMESIKTATDDLAVVEEDIIGTVENGITLAKTYMSCVKNSTTW